MTPFNTAEINRLMQTRRSVFVNQFEPDRVIPDEIIMQALENANTAPTHKLTEPWRFTVFTGEGLNKLADEQAMIYKNYAGNSFRQSKYEQMKVNPLLCSHVIAIGCKRNADLLPEIEEIAAVACAVQNIYLTVTAYGIGGYWSTGTVTFIEEAKTMFNLEPGDKLMGFFYLGYVKFPSMPARRTPVEEKTVWVRES
jgi:nitroreductase